MYRPFVTLSSFTLVSAAFALSGCFIPQDAIEVSNTVLDFGLNERPITMDVWNNNPDVGTLVVTIRPSEAWILTDVAEVTCEAPNAEGGLSKQAVQVTVDRAGLAPGEYEGHISFTAPGVVERKITVRARQQQNGGDLGALNIITPTSTYTDPYLIEFDFSLIDGEGAPIVAEPAQFGLTAREGDTEVGAETGVHLRRSAARQLKVNLVLDYSLSMQQVPNAIDAMEDAAKNILLPALNADALVGITEFHRDDFLPARVAGFTVDRNYLQEQIDRIQTEFVGGFSSGSRAWDAVVSAAETFGVGPAANEDRYIILFSDGVDTSSMHVRNDVVNEAIEREIAIFAIGFGENVNEATLEDITARTGGAYFPAESVGDLDAVFEEIVANLGAQYTLRWASLRRNDIAVRPSFVISLNDATDTYTAEQNFVATDYAENPSQALEGSLRLVPSDSPQRTTAFLRADYVPRFIYELRVYVESTQPFFVSVVEAPDDGLVDGWSVIPTEDPVLGGTWIDVTSPGDPIPFATFGPLLRFNFGLLVDPEIPLFDYIYVDNTIYEYGQSFHVEGFENILPSD